MSASREGSVSEPDFAHVSWSTVIERIRSLEVDGAFHSSDVGAFIRQYLDAVGRWLAPSGQSEAHYVALREDYGALWKEMLDVLGREGGDGVARLVPAQGKEFRRTVVRLAKEFGSEPRKLRDAVGDFLKRRGKFKTIKAQTRDKSGYLLYWEPTKLARALGVEACLRWGMEFRHNRIDVGFYFNQWSEDRQPVLDRIKAHLQGTPINSREPDWYPMKDYGKYFYVYHRNFPIDVDLSGMSTSKVKDVVLGRLTEFLDSDDSEYRRIDGYFRCLAFRPDAPAFNGKESP